MSDIRTWNPTSLWEAVDADDDADAGWYAVLSCGDLDGEVDTDEFGAHVYDADDTYEVECREEDHGLAVTVQIAADGTAVMYQDGTACFVMDAAAARVLVESMDPGSAFRWASAHAVARDWGMPFDVPGAAEAALVGSGV